MTGGRALDPGVVEVGFAEVDSPGRLEVVRSSPTILVDGAHNPAGAEALVEAVQEAFAFERLVGVVGVMADKDPEGILAALEPLLAEVVITSASTSRAMDVNDLAEIADRHLRRGPRARRRTPQRRDRHRRRSGPRARSSAVPGCSSPGRSCSWPRPGCCSVAPDLRSLPRGADCTNVQWWRTFSP